jgi:hypothetical protein
MNFNNEVELNLTLDNQVTIIMGRRKVGTIYAQIENHEGNRRSNGTHCS